MLRSRSLVVLAVVLLLGLTGCDALTPRPVMPTPAPSPLPVHWDKRAVVTLIRADRFTVPLSDEDFAARVPDCAVFGDGRVRWVEHPAADDLPPGVRPEHLGRLYESPVDADALAALLDEVISADFFALDPVYGPDLGPVRQLTIRVEGLGTHTVQVADITAAPEAFEALYTACDSLRQPENATEVIPTGGWIHAYPQAAPGEIMLEWPPDGPPLGLLAAQPRWYTNPDLIGMVWTAQRDYGPRATFATGSAQDPRPYRVIVRAEGITLDTPRAPREQDAPLPITTAWHPSPNAPAFVAWLEGGLPTPHAHLSPLAIPACLVFGDGRVIISEQPTGKVEIGTLSARQLAGFMEGWLNSGFFENTDPDPTPALPDAVVQVVTIYLRDGQSATHRYPLNTVHIKGATNPCEDLTEFAPYVPDRGYIWAEAIGPAGQFEGSIDYTLVPWPDDLIRLGHLNEPRWQGPITSAATTPTPGPQRLGAPPTPVVVVQSAGDNAALQFAWEHVHGGLHSAPNILFTEQGTAYAIRFNVSGITLEK
ncbi:MAG: hypothetical protein Kow0077_11980 [Anaerolineae bacterium]